MSDPSGVSPKGVLSRPPPDWFDDHVFVGGYVRHPYVAIAADAYVGVGLYNANPQGKVLKVYGVTVVSDSGAGCDAFFVSGTIGTLVGPAMPIRPDFPAPAVQIYQDTTTVVHIYDPPTYNYGAKYGTIATDGFDGANLLSPFPLFIVPTGYSLVIANSFSSQSAGATFWFQIADG